MKTEFDPVALGHLEYWINHEPRKAGKIIKLLNEIRRTPFEGTGLPEPLKANLSGCWSRRIDQEHRLVYKVEKDKIIILSCRYHY
jgi:toxin YoeB